MTYTPPTLPGALPGDRCDRCFTLLPPPDGYTGKRRPCVLCADEPDGAA